MLRRTVSLLLVVAFAACGSPPALDLGAGTNPLGAQVGGGDPLLPYPSDVFRVPDETMTSGFRVDLTFAAPLTDEGEPVDFTVRHPTDGFSPMPPILALFPGGVDDSTLPSLVTGLSTSLADDSQTLILDAETGEKILHLAELDPRAETDERRAFILRPMVRLEDATRYIVAIRNLKDPAGAAVPPPEGFRRIRDRETRGDEVLHPLQARFDDEVFPQLKDAGWDRKDLVLAWDFTTRTFEDASADMLTVREKGLAALATTTPAVTVVSVEDDPNEHLARTLRLRLTVPLFLEHANGGAALTRDANGTIVQNGTAQVDLTLLIPKSVADGTKKGRLVQFGHGFFGGRGEIEGAPIPRIANELGLVVMASDWWGMSTGDAILLGGDLIDDMASAFRFIDRLPQAMLNFMAATTAAQTLFGDLPELTMSGKPVFDASKPPAFWGISQGSILGSTYATLSPHVDRAMLEVGGAGFTLIMFRARPFDPFLSLMETGGLVDALDQQKMHAMSQTSFDRMDGMVFAPMMFDRPPEGAPKRHVLVQVGLGDSSVPNVAAETHARTLGLPLLTPAPRGVPGLEENAGPVESAIVEYDYGVPEPLPGTQAKFYDESGVHGAVRSTPSVVAQKDAFLDKKKVEHVCDGVCDPQ